MGDLHQCSHVMIVQSLQYIDQGLQDVPPLQALVLGQSLAGVATSVLSLITIWSSAVSSQKIPTAEDVSKPATIYFLACGLVVLLGIIGYWVLPHIDFVQHWALKEGTAPHSSLKELESSLALQSSSV